MGRLQLFFGVEGHRAGILTTVKHLLVGLEHTHEHLGVLVASGSNLLLLGQLSLNGLKVLKLQLGIDNVFVGCGVYGCPTLAHHIVVVEATDDMDNGVALTDVTQKLIAETLTLGRSFHQTCNVHNLTGCRNDAAGMNKLREFGKALVGHGDHTKVGFNSTKREVGCLCLSTRQAVEKRGLAYIRQTHDATF